MKAAAWIDRIKVTKNISSDYAAAKYLGLSQSSIVTMRRRHSTLDDDSALKVALALDIEPVIVLADQAMERAKSEEAKKAWTGVLDKLGASQLYIMLS